MYWLLEIDGWYPRFDERVMVTTSDSWVPHIQVISPDQTPVWIDTDTAPHHVPTANRFQSMGIEPQKTGYVSSKPIGVPVEVYIML